MEKKRSLQGPLTLLWRSPKVRTHLLTAGRELVMAVGAGLQALEHEALDTGLTQQYPYLHQALRNLQSAVTGLSGLVATCTAAPATTRNPASCRKPPVSKRGPRARHTASEARK